MPPKKKDAKGGGDNPQEAASERVIIARHQIVFQGPYGKTMCGLCIDPADNRQNQ